MDILKIVISLLDDKALRTLRAVNIGWHNLIRYSNFRLFFIRSADLRSLSHLNRYNYPISIKFAKMIVKPENLLPFLSSITNLASLAFGGPLDSIPAWMSLASLINLTSLKTDPPPPPSIPKHLSTIRQVNIRAPDDESDLTDLTTLRNLEHLYYELGDSDSNLQWLPNTSRLTSLIVRGYLENETRLLHMISEYVNLKKLTYDFRSTFDSFGFTRKLTALESLTITATVEIDLANLTRLTYLEISTPSLTNIGFLRRLKSLIWSNGKTVSNPSVYQGLTALTKLTKVSCTSCDAELFPYLPASLKSLDINGVWLSRIERRHINHLTNLEQLVLFHHVSEDFLTVDLTNLTSLKFGNPSINQLYTVATLSSLRVLECTYLYKDQACDFWNSGVLRSLPNLEVLRCETMAPVEECYLPPNLTALYANVGDEDDRTSSCYFLTQVTQLKVLQLLGVKRNTWENIAKLTNLEELCLVFVDGYDEDIQCLTALTKLKNIELGLNEREITASFVTKLTNLQKISFSEMTVKDSFFFSIPLEDLNEYLPYLYKIDYNVEQS